MRATGVKHFCWSERKFHDMTLRNVTPHQRQVPFMFSPPTSLPPERSSNAPLFACDEVLFHRPFPMPPKKPASARPTTAHPRNPAPPPAITPPAPHASAKQ